MKPRQKGLRKHQLKRFAANNVATKGRIDQTKMAENAWFGYTERAATIGAQTSQKFSIETRIETVQDGDRVHLIPVQTPILEESKVQNVDGHPHKTLYTRGKGNELNSSIPRVWTIAKLYQGHVRQQQQVRYTQLTMHSHPNGGIFMFYAADGCFFVEIDQRRKIERRSKDYPSIERAKNAFKLGRIYWL